MGQRGPAVIAQDLRRLLRTNFYGTVALTTAALPLLREAASREGTRIPCVVNVASMGGKVAFHRLSAELQQCFRRPELSLQYLQQLVTRFERSVEIGRPHADGWKCTFYGFSKLAVMVYTRLLARDEIDIRLNSCCPGYCATDLNSHTGQLSAADGAQTVLTAIFSSVSGGFFENQSLSKF